MTDGRSRDADEVETLRQLLEAALPIGPLALIEMERRIRHALADEAARNTAGTGPKAPVHARWWMWGRRDVLAAIRAGTRLGHDNWETR